MKKQSLLLLFLPLILFTSCKQFMYKIYGIKNIESFDQQLYESALKKMPIQEPQVYSVSLISDSNQFSKYTEVFKDLGEKNSKQPIQILYFNENKLSSFHANCFAKGTFTGNLKWNYRGDFDRFLPKSAIELPEGIPTVEHILKIYPLEKQIKLSNNNPILLD